MAPIPKAANPHGEDCNPLTEGMQFATTEVDAFALVAQDPFRDDAWRKCNNDIDLFPSYLKQVTAPTSVMTRTVIALHKAVKAALYEKDPRSTQNRTRFFSPMAPTSSARLSHQFHNALVISGETGLGKSSALQIGLKTIPQVIERREICGLTQVSQINWIVVDITAIASIEALAEQIIDQIDTLLGANGEIFDLTFRGVRGAHAKLDRALRRLRTHFVGILAIDEVQPHNFARSDAKPLRDSLLRIANQNIALAFSGNSLGFRLNDPKNQDEEYWTQVMRRLFASNEIRLEPAGSIEDRDWNIFSRTISRCHLVRGNFNYDLANEQLKWSRCGGFPDFYVDLHHQIELILHADPRRCIDAELIEQAARASTKLAKMAPLIEAFRDRDPIGLRRCRDVDHDYYLRKWTETVAPPDKDSSAPAAEAASSSPPESDPAKTLADERMRQAKPRAQSQTKAKSETAQSVAQHHLDELNAMIGKKDKAN